jgi:hypothetical protein
MGQNTLGEKSQEKFIKKGHILDLQHTTIVTSVDQILLHCLGLLVTVVLADGKPEISESGQHLHAQLMVKSDAFEHTLRYQLLRLHCLGSFAQLPLVVGIQCRLQIVMFCSRFLNIQILTDIYTLYQFLLSKNLPIVSGFIQRIFYLPS